ncbi:hypothetical protein HCZ30_10385 [Marivivens donghaensis]|uniref:HTH-like domain-containing protein n=1 Tax=Marivivens donghaensis TaxID=1699413 RepID=A0ABX0W1N6_9RHOB|nr:hypothetical protein [Marivivens donghaensis]NIY72837.1 hypothetical protein [Marivivens donghaensis]
MEHSVLVDELKRRYQSASKSEVALSIHLFGIEFADALQGASVHLIAEEATGHPSYGTEIRKGMRLAKYVQLKTEK